MRHTKSKVNTFQATNSEYPSKAGRKDKFHSNIAPQSRNHVTSSIYLQNKLVSYSTQIPPTT